jgi:hypothetical protein
MNLDFLNSSYYNVTRIKTDNATKRYAISLTTPFLTKLNKTRVKSALLKWIRKTFTSDIAEELIEVIKDFKIMDCKEVVLNHLMVMLLSDPTHDQYYSPWDLQKYIEVNPYLKHVFKHNTFTIDIEINNKRYNHLVNQEFIAGLTVIGELLGEGFNLYVFDLIYRYPLAHSSHMLSHGRYKLICKMALSPEQTKKRRGKKPEPNFEAYSFETMSFLQGFMTGALWQNKNYEDYIVKIEECINTSDVAHLECVNTSDVAHPRCVGNNITREMRIVAI